MNAVVSERRPQPGVGLAMSGGGYRASLFHLGSLRRLAELGVLERVVHVASVSGGSITAGLVAADLIRHPVAGHATDPWSARIERVGAQLRAFCATTIDTGTIIGGVLMPFRRVSDLLADAYEALYGELRLSQLPADGPRFTFCATNLQTGRLVHLTRGAVVDYRIGRAAVDVPLARAVAASSAFPPFLSPVVIDCEDATWTRLAHSTLHGDARFTRRLYLTDGGAYDNMGLEPVWNDYEAVLVSDAGAPYQPEADIDANWFSQLHCVYTIATDQARGVRKRWLVDQFQRGVRQGTYWGINTGIGQYGLADALGVSPAMTTQLAAMRTRLNAFTDEEQERLINWGYAVTDAAMRRWCGTLCTGVPVAAAFPYPTRDMA